MTKHEPQKQKGMNSLHAFLPLWLRYFLGSVFLLIITFPKIRPEFTLGIDPQIHWVFNHLWITNFSKTQNIIFPHGPLTFINFPLSMGNNLTIGLIIQAILRLTFISSFLFLASLSNSSGPRKNRLLRWFASILLCFLILEFMELDFIIIGIVANAVFLFFLTNKNSWYALGVVAFALGFYIKTSIGITSLSILLSGLVFYFLEKRKIKTLVFQSLAIPISIALGWFLLYQNFDFFGKYLFGLLELIGGNSDSASLYPDNNWWLLGASILPFLVIPIYDIWKNGLEKSRSTWLVYILLGFSVFAIWKHSMAREDPWHIIKMFAWMSIFYSYIFILQKKINWSTVILSVTSLFFFHANIISTLGMFVEELDTNGYKNFSEAFIHQKDFFQKNKDKSIANVEPCRLNKFDRAFIKNQTVDCYPMNYGFIAANNLNWQPRPIIQSYAAYTPWLDEQNAKHFTSENAPQFLIWETDILNRDTWDAELISIDKHYLLNDEPQTVAAILSNYSLVNKTDDYLLFEKNKNSIFEKPTIKSTKKSTWNKWIDVPHFGDGILRAKFSCQGNFIKWLKAKAYKDEPLFIEYLHSNNEIRKHRITTLNAEQGLWVNPFIIQPSSDLINSTASKIRFSTANKIFTKKEIQVSWEFFPIKKTSSEGSYSQTFNFFGKNILQSEELILEKNDALITKLFLKSKQYSPTCEIPFSKIKLDSTSTISVAASVEANMSYHAQGLLVIVVEQDGKAIFWEGKKIENFMTIYNKWELAFSKKTIPNSVKSNAVLKVYVWNTGKENFSIKNLSVKCFENKKL